MEVQLPSRRVIASLVACVCLVIGIWARVSTGGSGQPTPAPATPAATAVPASLQARLLALAATQAAPAPGVRSDDPLAGELPLARPRSRVNLRAGPGTSFPVLGSAGPDEVLRVRGRNVAGDWWQIWYEHAPDGRAWVSASVVSTEGPVDRLPTVEVGQ